jgi:multicomponent K+:H+ antiporter subunit E
MKLRWPLVPAPRLIALLWLAWLMLNQSLSAGHLLLGAALAGVLPLLCLRLHPALPSPAAAGTTLRLLATLLWDVVVSNLEVARRVLGPEAAVRPRWVWVPLRLRSPQALAALAGVVTLTPGTLSAAFSVDRRQLLVHALHCPTEADAAALVATIQTRYETPLLEIFG